MKKFLQSIAQNPIQIFVLCLILPAFLFIANAASSLLKHPIKVDTAHLDSAESVWFIMNVIPGSKSLKFTGWASIRGISDNRYNWETPSYNTQQAVYTNNQVVLQDSHGKLFGLKTYSVPDPSISIRVDDVRTHDNDGYMARILRQDLQEGEVYKVGVLLTKLHGGQILVFSKNEIKR